MVSKEDVRRLVDFIIRRTGQTQEELTSELGYGKNYISDILSPSGNPTKKFINLLNKKYNEVLKTSENTKTKKVEPLSFEVHKSIQIEGMLRVVLMSQAEILANQRKESVTKVIGELTKAVEDEISKTFDELKRKA